MQRHVRSVGYIVGLGAKVVMAIAMITAAVVYTVGVLLPGASRAAGHGSLTAPDFSKSRGHLAK